ncbi:putative aldehyde dehydrogenase-like protein [Cyphellophora attinorum]|uniref:aldehyde dehydrogenase (NAD(+)) n=1 Tax=Cyphellophora attinorum TaxID=1664694 RepID=A0A0N0NMW0_9EURO|nr:putative aldehyde dehydrogenase-like protein [Phialophora attinorum]KPI40669.1 putative aldehyde dehydrogenase-like protein [Phialophora attinorum]
MQQWEEWSDRQYGTLLLEKSFLTLLVVLITFCLWTWVNSWSESARDVTVEIPAQLSKKWQIASRSEAEVQHRWEEISDGKIYPRCPADGRLLQTEPIVPATTKDIDDAIAQAAAAQRKWSTTTFSQRRRVLNTLRRYIIQHQDDIVTACCLDSGKTKIDAGLGEILVTVEKLQWTVEHGEKALAPSRRPTNLLMSYKQNTVYYEPLGVVAACVSWNYPFHNFISPIISALFSGNAIVVKPSELTCWSTQYFTSFIRQSLVACGHDPNLVQPIVCLPSTADYLTSHPVIAHITFIGSREVAHKVAASAAESLTPTILELGGKDPAIILDDPKSVADLESVASILLRGFFQSAGQNCIGLERAIALPNIHDALLEYILPTIKSLRLGSVLLDASAPDMGAMISSRSFSRLEGLIDQAVQEGATLHCGGTRYAHPQHPRGHYFLPTLLSNVTHNMAIAQTELFAPVFLLMRASSVSDAIAIANSTPYALGASVFGHNSQDVQRCVKEIRAGNVAVNDFATFYVCSMPFGGRGGSGYGRFGGEEGLRGLCNLKSVCEDAGWAAALGIQTKIPGVLRYPVEGMRGWDAVRGIVRTGYGVGVMERVRGMRQLMGSLLSKSKGEER